MKVSRERKMRGETERGGGEKMKEKDKGEEGVQ